MPSAATNHTGAKMTENIVEKVLKQKQELEQNTKEAIKVLLKQLKGIESQLMELGYEPTPMKFTKPSNGKAKKRTGTKQKRAVDPNKVCKVCGEKGHDARRHRFEGKKKKG
jgi:hypothetical protein